MAIDASRLRIAVEEKERWRRTLQVTVPADIVEEEREKAARKLAGRVKMHGFRKGRIPANVVEKRFGESLERETLDKVINEAYGLALQIESLRPINEGEVDDIHFEPGADLTFRIAFDVSPEIELARLGGFRVERPRVEIREEDTERMLQRIREQNGVWKPADEGNPVDGDLVSVEVVRLVDGDEAVDSKSYELVLGQGDALPDVERAIQSLTPGGTGDFTIRFPDDFSDEARRGEEQRLRIQLQTRKVRELPDLDDAFARSVGEFDSLADLRAKIRQDLEAEAEARADAAVRGRLVDDILQANSFEVPVSMVDRYLAGILGDGEGIPEEKLQEVRESLRPEAETAVKRLLLIDHIAETQSLRATREEVDERVAVIAERNNLTASQVYSQLQRSGRLDSLEREISERKVLEFLVEQSEVAQAT